MHNAERRKQQFPSGMRMMELLAKAFVKNLVCVATNSRSVANRNCGMEDFRAAPFDFPSMRTGNVMSEALRESVFR